MVNETYHQNVSLVIDILGGQHSGKLTEERIISHFFAEAEFPGLAL